VPRVSIVHVVNGDTVAASLAEAELPGDIVVWADALDDGPLPPLPDDDYRRIRAAHWGLRSGHDVGGDTAFRTELAAADQAVDDAAASAAEIVFWYEHDLFDQLALARLLSRVGASRVGASRVGAAGTAAELTMVSIDRHDEVADFRGLGQLEAHQLAQLWPGRIPITREALDEAAAAWIAVTAADPRGVGWVARRVRVLPFLGPALERHLEELPDRTTGLSRTEAQLVRAVDRGVDSIAALIAATPVGERYYPTDVTVWQAVRSLVDAGVIAAEPALTDVLPRPRHTDADARIPGLRATPLGTEVLSGRVDRVARAGLDGWRGGVRLLGNGPMWRWDAGARRVVWA
jgi:Domain of unknown function (DUF1835)